MSRRSTFLTLILFILLTATLSGCANGSQPGAAGDELKMAPLRDLPDEVKQSPVSVQDAYRFNVANPDIMQQIPCYCGCGGMGHTSNYACYIQDDSGGKLSFDGHALGCSICVDITADTMRLLQEGKSIAEIKQAIDDTYAKFGPSNLE